MRISPKLIESLKLLLKEQSGLDYTDEEVQEAGIAIMRFTAAKLQRANTLSGYKEADDGNSHRQQK